MKSTRTRNYRGMSRRTRIRYAGQICVAKSLFKARPKLPALSTLLSLDFSHPSNHWLYLEGQRLTEEFLRTHRNDVVTEADKVIERHILGTFDTAQEAALAYDDAATSMRDSKAKTNFPPLEIDLGLNLHTSIFWDAGINAVFNENVAERDLTASYYGNMQRGLAVDLNEPPPVWL